MPITYHTEPHSDDFERKLGVLETPAGPLHSVALRSLKGDPGLTVKHLIGSRSDAETFLSLPVPKLCGTQPDFLALDRQIGQAGITEVRLGDGPAGFVASLWGSQAFAMASLTDRDILHAMLERHQKVVMSRLKHALSLGVGPFFALQGQEWVAPPLHGPVDFREFAVRYEKPIIDAIHDAGGRVRVHCHGRLGRIFSDLVDMGVDVLHPVEPPPMGDITAAQAKAIARDRLCIEGNIQIADLYEQTPDRIREQTELLIQDAFDDRKGLIVSPSDALYQREKGHQCLQQCKAMIRAVLDSRR
jgi:hypothetical protein